MAMVLLNPSLKTITAKYDGGLFIFKPGEKKEFFNTYAAKHILERWKKYGLVDITYDDRIAEKFIVEDMYIHVKSIEGMQSYIKSLIERDQKFQVFDDECGEKRTPERYDMQNHHKQVKKDLEIAEKKLKELELTDTDLIVSKQADVLRKKAEEMLAKANQLSPKAEANNVQNFNKPQGSSPSRVARS